jgi:hypothetical protein
VSAPPAAAAETVAVGTAAPTNYESSRGKKKKQILLLTTRTIFVFKLAVLLEINFFSDVSFKQKLKSSCLKPNCIFLSPISFHGS